MASIARCSSTANAPRTSASPWIVLQVPVSGLLLYQDAMLHAKTATVDGQWARERRPFVARVGEAVQAPLRPLL
jgi:hypothetical protein